MFSGLISAIRTLTIFPVPGKDVQKKYNGLPWFAVVGMLIGGLQLCSGHFFGNAANFSMVLFAGLLVAIINYVITGGLHLDGLADYLDAFGTLHERQKTLTILKDPHIGVFGVAGIVFAILIRIVAYHILITVHAPQWILYCIIFSRTCQALILAFLPYARGDEGKAHGYHAPAFIRAFVVIESIIFIVVLAFYESFFRAIIPVMAGTIMVFFVCRTCLRRIGGITGDCVGASSELLELVFLTGAISCLH